MSAVKSHESPMTFAHVGERKGPVDSTTRPLVAGLGWLGLRILVFKSDQEPAIPSLERAVRESMSTVEFVMKESLVESALSSWCGTLGENVTSVVPQCAAQPIPRARPADALPKC